MSLNALLSIVLPVFGFIAFGYAIVATKLLRDETTDALANFVFTISVPLLLFRALGTLEFPDVSPWPFWGAYFLGVVINMALGMVITEALFRRDARAGVIGGLCTSFSNTVMVGIPVVSQAFGDAGLVTGFMLIAVHLPFMMAVSALLIAVAEVRDGTAAGGVRLTAVLGKVGRSLIRNPLIIAILAGVAFRLTGLPLEGIPRTLIDRLSDTAIPLALVSLGMSLVRYPVSGNVMPGVVLGAVKLLVMPAIAYVLAVHVFALPDIAAATAVLMAACPSGVNVYLIATRFQTGLALSANTITLTSAVAVVTFTFWLSVFGV